MDELVRVVRCVLVMGLFFAAFSRLLTSDQSRAIVLAVEHSLIIILTPVQSRTT